MDDKYSSLPHRRNMPPPASRRGVSTKSSGPAGAIDEDTFIQSFEQVPSISFYSAKDLSEQMTKIKDVLGGPVEDWEKRVDNLRLLRSVVLGGGNQYDEFPQLLRSLEIPMQTCTSDLRSLVVREACISVAFLSQELKNRFDHFAEAVMPSILNLILNSAKVMASSGVVALRFIFQNTPSPRLVLSITSSLSSKSSVMRRQSCELLETMCRDWPTNALEKHIGPLQEAIKKGIGDADQDARAFARRAFCWFCVHFRHQAEALYQSLDNSKQKMIEKDMANCGVQNFEGGVRQGMKSAPVGNSMRRLASSNSDSSSGRSRLGSNNQNSTRVDGLPRGRQPMKKMVSQSQPTSREVSPSTRVGHAPIAPQPAAPRYRVARSQHTSREASPNRAVQPGSYASTSRRGSTGTPKPIYKSKNIYGQPVLSQESEQAVVDALARDRRRRFDANESDDNASETGSMCSDSSFQASSRVTKNMQEILIQLNSSQWADKKAGLMNFQNFLRSNSGQKLQANELRKVTEVFTKLFQDSQSKVVSLYMDTLQLFVKEYHPYLHEWVYILLIRLLTRQGNEVSGNQQKRIQETLFVVRSNFPLDLQFQLCCKFVIDNAQAPSIKVKTCLLEYMKDLLLLLSPNVIDNPSRDMNMAVSRIISWTLEPKSVELRKLASRLLLKLFDLNTNGFSAIMQTLPRSFQESAYKALQGYMSSDRGDGPIPGDLSSGAVVGETRRRGSVGSQRTGGGGGLPVDLPAEQISQEDISTFIRQTTEDIESLSCNYDRMDTSTTSPTQRLASGLPTGSTHRRGSATGLPQPMRRPSGGDLRDQELRSGDLVESNGASGAMDSRRYHPNYYPPHEQSSQAQRAPPVAFDKKPELLPDEAITNVLDELASQNTRSEQQGSALLRLMKLLREKGAHNWDDHFKTTLLLLLETLGDPQVDTRALALRVLQELLRTQPDRFREYSHLTIVKVLEAHSDPEKQVVRAAEDCAQTLAGILPQELCLRVLIPIVMDADLAIHLAALKIQALVVKETDAYLIESLLPEMAPGLAQGCNHTDSHIRKASIFSLVEIFLKIGDTLYNHLSDLNNGKIRLLNLYIQRTKENRDTTGTSRSSGASVYSAL